MKRDGLRKSFFIGGLILILIGNVCFVSAQNQMVDQVYNKLGEAFSSILAPIFDVEQVDEFLFAKALLFIMLFSVIFLALYQVKIFKRNKPTRVIVALVVSILAVRYLKETDFIRAILLPYGALGGSITILLPLIIYFFFVHTSLEGGFGRRFAWFLYGIILLFLWGTQEYMGSANWIYIASLIFVLLNLVFDKSIHRYFKMGEFDKSKRKANKIHLARLKRAVNDAREANDDDLAEDLEQQLRDFIRSSNL